MNSLESSVEFYSSLFCFVITLLSLYFVLNTLFSLRYSRRKNLDLYIAAKSQESGTEFRLQGKWSL